MKRRGFLLGSAAVLVAGGAGLYFAHPLARRYAPTPYDDLLDQITDRQPAARFGQAVLKAMPNFDTARVAATLRRPENALARRAGTDAGTGQVTEADGWIVPQSVALYAALAAKV
jgi:hypothetical protein